MDSSNLTPWDRDRAMNTGGQFRTRGGAKHGPVNRHTLIRLLEQSIEAINDVVAKGDNLRRLVDVQVTLSEALDWLDPDHLEREADVIR